MNLELETELKLFLTENGNLDKGLTINADFMFDIQEHQGHLKIVCYIIQNMLLAATNSSNGTRIMYRT